MSDEDQASKLNEQDEPADEVEGHGVHPERPRVADEGNDDEVEGHGHHGVKSG